MSAPAVPAVSDPVSSWQPPVPSAPARRSRGVPAVLAVLGVACLAVVVPIYRAGRTVHTFPSYVEGEPVYVVENLAGSWVATAIGVAALGLLLLVVAAGRLYPGARSWGAAAGGAASGDTAGSADFSDG